MPLVCVGLPVRPWGYSKTFSECFSESRFNGSSPQRNGGMEVFESSAWVGDSLMFFSGASDRFQRDTALTCNHFESIFHLKIMFWHSLIMFDMLWWIVPNPPIFKQDVKYNINSRSMFKMIKTKFKIIRIVDYMSTCRKLQWSKP